LALSFLRFPNIDPIAFRVGPLAVHWYGLAYAAGFLAAYALLLGLIRSGRFRVTRDQLADLFVWLVLGVVVGGRAGWWLVYHRAGGAPEPWYEPLAFWHGGMSFHGGLAGVGLAIVLWARRARAPLLNVLDAVALVAPIGLFLGRLANFVNGELIGRATSVTWAVLFPGESVPRHPSQIYEALLEGPVLFAALWLLSRAAPPDGRIAALFAVLYGVFRFGVEFTRQPDAQIGFIAGGWLTMGQLLSVALAVAGAWLWTRAGQVRGVADRK
jgi:phosphatidylglycerol---prolipoprotein diacylglyceryl transferase